MQIEQRKVSDIKPYENNPRLNDCAVNMVAASIRRFGFVVPINVDTAGVIISGHTRWKAALQLGLETIPVHVLDKPPDEVRALRLADNQVGSSASWDNEKLRAEIGDLPDFDWTALGWTAQELKALTSEHVAVRLAPPPPPQMAWVLFCLPMNRYPEVAQAVEKLSAVPGIKLEVMASDQTPD